MQEFVDAEDAYLDWVARNPHGYVVNVQRTLNPNDVHLHSASCRSISGAHELDDERVHQDVLARPRRA